MSQAVDALILDLVEWIARRDRTYDEVMDAWRTSCPRLTIWEDAVDRGFVRRELEPNVGVVVRVTEDGLRLLAASGRAIAA